MISKRSPVRKSGLERVAAAKKNIYCNVADLSNEASVEHFFVSRMIDDLGYPDSSVKTKQSLPLLTISRGRRKEKYKPDYALQVKRLPRCLIDAKGTNENLEDWVEQGSGYCLALNRKHKRNNPVRYFVLTNGLKTVCYQWDSDEPLVTLSFGDFKRRNPKYQHFINLLSASEILSSIPTPVADQLADYRFERPTTSRARQLFQQCHKIIWKSEGYGPAPAFLAFVKLMFVKLYADQNLRDDATINEKLLDRARVVQIAKEPVTFSSHWITERQKEGTINPINDTFIRLRDEIERAIGLKNKKRIFLKDEDLGLGADTVMQVVKKLEHFDMFGIDEDLNGRLFETFLAATMRGRELGQFFTPRSVVKMMTQLAGLRVTRKRQDRVLDGCCGTGGFLIESLAVMRNTVRVNRSLSSTEKNNLIAMIANECIHGIDYGQDPPLARVARINMFLHGDGGSSIYYGDTLDKDIDNSTQMDPETVQNLDELKTKLDDTLFDVVLTNPPFSMTKEKKNPSESRVLQMYDLAHTGGSNKLRSSLRSSIMFMERYHDLLKPGGKLLTVIDETLLSSKHFAFVRTFLRERFLIRAIISLPGDTFRRSGSRVKTSVLYLEKKRSDNEQQGNWFHYFSMYLGVDDLPSKASERDVARARQSAEEETERICIEFERYLDGESTEYVLTPDLLENRLDLRNCVPLLGRRVPVWKQSGIVVKYLDEVVDVVDSVINPHEHPDTLFNMLKVSYAGECELDEVRAGKDILPREMRLVEDGQIIFSIIRATDGSIGIVPPEFDGGLVSKTSFMVFRCDSPEDAAYLWSVLRSYEMRADMQSMSPGSTRYQTPWEDVRNLQVPWLRKPRRQRIGAKILDVWVKKRSLQLEAEKSMRHTIDLLIETDESRNRFDASKAPK